MSDSASISRFRTLSTWMRGGRRRANYYGYSSTDVCCVLFSSHFFTLCHVSLSSVVLLHSLCSLSIFTMIISVFFFFENLYFAVDKWMCAHFEYKVFESRWVLLYIDCWLFCSYSERTSKSEREWDMEKSAFDLKLFSFQSVSITAWKASLNAFLVCI